MNTRDKIIPLRVIAEYPKKQSIKTDRITANTIKHIAVFFSPVLNLFAAYLEMKSADKVAVSKTVSHEMIIQMLPDNMGEISGVIGLITEIIATS